MKKLHFDYYMQITYSKNVEKCHYTIKCIPVNTDRQRIEEINIEMVPKNSFSKGEDSFGNRMIYGSIEEVHTQFSFHIKGKAVTGITDAETVGSESLLGMYRYPYGLTVPGEELASYYHSLNLENGLSAYETGTALMHRLYRDFSYEKNVTDITTTAEEAWKLGRGVCQDYAHILIALCRMAGISARYVTGMLIGEGYSHAWVEILSENKWYALDPTNNLIVTDSHIKLGTGRDASDCMINRGVIIGGGSQTQEIRVSVEEII
ncbi:MAG: transglutaminase domain-containing protein [Lachnospiraceae bacterium]